MLHEKARAVSREMLEPLCEATAKIFLPLDLSPDDRLELNLSDDGRYFEAEAYGLTPGEYAWMTSGLRRRPEKVFLYGTRRRGYPSFAATKFIQRIPECKVLPGYACWRLATTDFTALVINALWAPEQLKISEDARVVYDYLLARFLGQTRVAKLRAQFVREKAIPPVEYVDNKDLPLAPYQRVGYATTIGQEASALFMEQGTGKTPVVIARICNEALKKNGSMHRALIVAPKNVRTNWRNEFIRFATVPGKVTVLRGGGLKRVKQLIEALQKDDDCRWTAVVCSYESVARSWDALRMIEWDLCVLDESHYVKSTRTQRFKKIRQLRELCEQRMCLTGTPITNHIFDLYAQFEFLGDGLSGFSNYEAFRSYYGKWKRTKFADILTGYRNLPLLQERLARLAFMVRKCDALPGLPEKVYDVIEIEMTPRQAELYSKLQAQLAIEIAAEIAGDPSRTLTATNILTRLLRLAQITSGFVVWDPRYADDGEILEERGIDRIDPNPKLEALVGLLREKTPSDKTIVWACWKQDIKSIAARLALEGIDCVTYYGSTSEADRETAVQRFNTDPTCQVFIGNPTAGGQGLNLLGYDYSKKEEPIVSCNHVIYYSQNWSMTARSQSEDRTHRRGTKVHVRYTDLCVPSSIDEEIRSRVTQKRLTAYAIQDVRDIMDRVLNTSVEVGD